MYIFKEVKADIREGKLTINFYQNPDDFLPFKEAKKAANLTYLKERLEEMREALKSGRSKEILLATEKYNSALRGYRGGLLHITNKQAILLQRGLDAPSSPGKLDICAGRLVSKDEGDWLSVILGEGLEEVAKLDDTLYIPQLKGKYISYNHYVQQRVIGEALKSGVYDRNQPTKEFDVDIVLPENAAAIRIHYKNKPVVLEFQAGWTALPELSSIELFAYAQSTLPEYIRFHDTENFRKGDIHVGINRDIFAIDQQTGDLHIWKSGRSRTASLKEELKKTEELLKQNNITDLELVSPKVKAAIEQWPKKLGDKSKLEILLTY